MSVAERLLKRLEANISQSLGVRDAETPGSGPQGAHPSPPTPLQGPTDGRTRARSLGIMDIRNIAPDPDQPRKEFDEAALARLSESLAKFGQLLPIRVRWDEGRGKWLIISGERRYRAALTAGLETVTCHFVDEELSPSQILEEQLVENCLREDLKPVEQARAYRALMEANGWSARRVADELHLASSTVVKALSLLRIPEEVQEQVDAGVIPRTAAYELSKLDGPEAQREAAERMTREKLSRKDAVTLVREATGRMRRKSDSDGNALKEPVAPTVAPGLSEPVGLRQTRVGGEHRGLEYSLPNDVRLTITTRSQATASDLVFALESALLDLRARVARVSDRDIPWADSPDFL